MITSRKAADLEIASKELKSRGVHCEWAAADCAQESQITDLVGEAIKRMNTVDILVNNAGASWGAPAESHPLEAWDKVMNLNVRGYFLLSQQVANASMIPGIIFLDL